ncbi:hypothetical protein [Janthinobacterium sp. BJB304]|uniref:hypothetical protein n=1 Tax=Janthinobacterium sp. BJB304 TaxID=1572871 RepID=UPI00117AC22C|nr:hypothetical protein [Janthinobacterium sp. BJB304]
MCDECNPFERLLAKADVAYRRLRSIRWDQGLRYVEGISPALAQATQHTGIGIASGLFTGLILFGLQFTSDQPVNDMAKSLQRKFIVHDQDIPAPLFNLVLFLVACTMLLTAEWGHFFRQKVLVPVIHGISHTVSISTGMLLSLVFSDVLTTSFLPNIGQWLFSLLIISIVWILAVTMNAVIYLCRYGVVGYGERRAALAKSVLHCKKSTRSCTLFFHWWEFFSSFTCGEMSSAAPYRWPMPPRPARWRTVQLHTSCFHIRFSSISTEEPNRGALIVTFKQPLSDQPGPGRRHRRHHDLVAS